MRGQYEAYILVEVKGGHKYVCGMNRVVKPQISFERLSEEEKKRYLEMYCLWN